MSYTFGKLVGSLKNRPGCMYRSMARHLVADLISSGTLNNHLLSWFDLSKFLRVYSCRKGLIVYSFMSMYTVPKENIRLHVLLHQKCGK